MRGARWPVELCFAESKDDVGLDHYETRSWRGWQHHMVLVMLAHHFLVRLRVQWQGAARTLTLAQVRVLLRSVLPPRCLMRPPRCDWCSITSAETMLRIWQIGKPACNAWPFRANFAL